MLQEETVTVMYVGAVVGSEEHLNAGIIRSDMPLLTLE